MNGVKESDCTYCIHREVCGIKKDYLDLLSKLPDLIKDTRFTVKMSCKHCALQLALRNNYPDVNTTATMPY